MRSLPEYSKQYYRLSFFRVNRAQMKISRFRSASRFSQTESIIGNEYFFTFPESRADF
jgi:hypothetical protein